jgi:hypothetical protein
MSVALALLDGWLLRRPVGFVLTAVEMADWKVDATAGSSDVCCPDGPGSRVERKVGPTAASWEFTSAVATIGTQRGLADGSIGGCSDSSDDG